MIHTFMLMICPLILVLHRIQMKIHPRRYTKNIIEEDLI